jgi:hypothetical protein
VAEAAWTALADRQDMLRLLALAVKGLGAKGLDDYEPPSAQLAEFLAEREAEAPPLNRGTARVAEVAAFVHALGGEAG